MRKLIYQWEHMPADMVIEPAVYSPLVVDNTAFGITENVDLALTDEANSVVSRHLNIQIRDEDDLEKIKVPVVTHDNAGSEAQYRQLREIMDGAIEVRKLGANGFLFWFAPWDELIRWWGVQEALIDLYDRPDLVHKAPAARLRPRPHPGQGPLGQRGGPNLFRRFSPDALGVLIAVRAALDEPLRPQLLRLL